MTWGRPASPVGISTSLQPYSFFQHSFGVSPFLNAPVTKSLHPIPQRFMSWLLPLFPLSSHYPLLLPPSFVHSKSYNCLSLSHSESHFPSISCICYAGLNPICCSAWSSSISLSECLRVGHSRKEQNGLLPAAAVKLSVFFFFLPFCCSVSVGQWRKLSKKCKAVLQP